MVRPLIQDWEFNVLDIANYRRRDRLKAYFDFIIDHHEDMEGNICEAGVYRGRSLLATALLLKDLGSDKMVYGFDSFKGMPQPTREDHISAFSRLLGEGEISAHHMQQVKRLWEFRAVTLGERPTLENISVYAGTMRDPRLETLRRKIKFLRLDNIVLVEGTFEETMQDPYHHTRNCHAWMAALVDCDLYESYKSCLPPIWEALVPGGFIFLDEYYSLKFPGARIATNEFFEDKEESPALLSIERGQFERWGAYKNA